MLETRTLRAWLCKFQVAIKCPVRYVTSMLTGATWPNLGGRRDGQPASTPAVKIKLHLLDLLWTKSTTNL